MSDNPSRSWKKYVKWGLRIAGTAVGFGYIASIVEFDQVSGAIMAVSPWAFAGACLATALNLVVGATRWRILLSAYAAEKSPSLLFLTKAYWIGFFYNNFLPGGIGGDVVRGVITRESFGDRGATAAVTVVLVERVLGLSGLLLLVSATYLVRPIPGTEAVLPYSGIALLIAAAAVAGIAMSRRLAPHLPDKVAKIAWSLPTIERGGMFSIALAISLVTQSLAAIGGWFLLLSVSGGTVSIGDAFVLVPLAMATAFFPLSVGGAGAREAAFVTLCALALGMAEADALAVSLLMWLTQLVVAAPGGAIQLLAPIRADAESPAAMQGAASK